MNRFIFAFVVLIMAAAGYAASRTLIAYTDGNLASVFSSQRKILYAECISSFSNEPLHAFAVTQAHLNTDTQPDAIVQYMQGPSCGSAGCVFELCVWDDAQGYIHVPFGLAAKELTVREVVNNGMKDLMLNQELTMTWDGTKYVLDQN